MSPVPKAMRESCVACHEEIGMQVSDGVGFHGQLEAAQSSDCALCHREHAGRDFPLVHRLSFLEAGFAKRELYDHPGLDYGLNGAHNPLDCGECHEHADVDLLAAGWTRFGGLSQDCATCHEDPHEGRMAESCESCHGQTEPFEDFPEFVHTEAFALVGAHGGLACVDCHQADTAYSIEGVGGVNPPADRGCADCHGNEHALEFLQKTEALEWRGFTLTQLAAASPRDRACAGCHDPEAGDWGRAAERLTELQHLASSFPLEDPHAGLQCGECHGEPGNPWLERFPGRTEKDCQACHGDPHDGQFRTGAFASAGCVTCHGESHFVPSVFDFSMHAQSAFPLEGNHRSVACRACHKPLEGEPLAATLWSGVSTECVECHDDAHDGKFDGWNDLRRFAGETGCARCHDPSGFDGIRQEEFDHGVWTPFPLQGAHKEAGCEVCHPTQAERDATGRAFGRVVQAFGGEWEASTPCSLCHGDPHPSGWKGPLAWEGRRDCARCHTEVDWHSIQGKDFDHGLWTGYALEGGMPGRIARLAICGPRGRIGWVVVLAWWRRSMGWADPSCQQCHPDPHLGIFEDPRLPKAVEGREGCARCHTEERFDKLHFAEFDHDLWTGSKVRSGHAALGCDDCHPPLTGEGPRGRGRRPPAGSSCVDCHADPHMGQFVSASNPLRAADCDDCHGSQADWSVLVFDHDQDSRYALDELHAALDCSECHKKTMTAGGLVVRYKPLGVECIDCHTPGGQD